MVKLRGDSCEEVAGVVVIDMRGKSWPNRSFPT